ncbi:NAD(P)-binding protein [Corynespora cassiicola Philippines]|uniref:NAD(P)-binding protein n=1 Tax=Corynespora cassiicola Philippines TaxID=1448308 RepID=A0A2T2NSX5_CORCC|nr:NAD(P)-binding protein [Corynespora cassiicola Philippines]
MSIQNVALVGGTGTLGAPVLEVLKASPLTTFVLNRASSKSTYNGVNVITIPNDLNVDTLASLFKQHAIDAIILAIKGSYVEQQRTFIDAAFAGGVKRVIPAEFGSCDSADDKTNEILPLMKGKKGVRDYLISLQDKERPGTTEKLSWTALVTGHFFDHGIVTPLLKFDVQNRKAYLVDGGDIKFSASTLPFIGRAVAAVLQKPEETKNRLFYVHSNYVTQLELLDALERATGDKFERIAQSSEEELKVVRPKMLEGDFDAMEEVVAIWGVVASDWKNKPDFANGLLGLQEEDLDTVVKAALEHA